MFKVTSSSENGVKVIGMFTTVSYMNDYIDSYISKLLVWGWTVKVRNHDTVKLVNTSTNEREVITIDYIGV